ncbi:uncharacterized protein V1518DRAFT_408134 [Limtongia smithiae]|uniref:uncharacterized protein n=1 Tax=Limtongia smithiae TaxID=1125753 RepID=UPI0034CD4074
MKRLIILCDGTWQSTLSWSPQETSNIARIARALKTLDDRHGGSIPQVVYYQPGLGTDGGALYWMTNLFAGAFGWGILEQIREVYNFISYNYEPGDELFMFGFSRGAFLVRAIVRFICDFGIIRKAGMSKFIDVFRLYLASPGSGGSERLQEKQHELDALNLLITCDKVTISVLGCFDTVGALGIPRWRAWGMRKYELADLCVYGNIRHVFHALALDEDRKIFKPTLFFFPQHCDMERYKQVWFSGAHINVGGGSFYHAMPGSDLLPVKDGDTGKKPKRITNVLSDGPLIWMISECESLLAFDFHYLQVNIRSGHTTADGELNFHEHAVARTAAEAVASRALWFLGPICNNFAGLEGMVYRLLGRRARAVGGYTNLAKKTHTADLGLLKVCYNTVDRLDGGPYHCTNEMVHESVVQRMDTPGGKRSRALGTYEIVSDSGVQKGQCACPRDGKVQLLGYSPAELAFWTEAGQDVSAGGDAGAGLLSCRAADMV